MEIISQEDIKLKKQQDARSALVKKYKRYRKILNKKMLNKISNDENILIHLKNEENIDYIIEEFKKEILNISSLKSNIKKISVMETYLNEKYNKLISDLNEINNFDKFILYSCFDELLTNDMSIFNNSFVFNLISNTNFIKIKTKLNEKIQLKFYNQDLIIDINLSYDNKILKAKSLENLKKLKSLESKKNIISKIEFSEFEVEKFLIETFEKITKDNILINKDNLLKKSIFDNFIEKITYIVREDNKNKFKIDIKTTEINTDVNLIKTIKENILKTVFNTTDSRLSGFTRSVNRKVIQNIIEIDSFKNLYPAARMANRKIHYYFGETNSGKTFNAFEEASKYNSGLYAAPLRLLALEGQEEFEKRGKTCSMITGEERDEKEGAKFISSTVEMVDYSREYDVAIIDEVQLINDINRGHSWFEAIVGINAKNIYLVGSEDADLVIKEVIEYLGEELIKKEFKRKTRLEFDKELYRNSIKNIGKLPPNSAVIAFSKSKVLKLKKQFENMGNKVSVIYGALPPEVRKIETARFNTGKTDVIIATDAIGMGLNLPIENIFFYENMKFDGVNTIDLDASLVKQIVGRAGRYNKFEVGYVSALSDEVFDFINKEFYKDSFINKRSVKCSPNYQIIKQISLLTSENEIFKLLQNYNNAINFDFDIKNHMNEHSYTIARYLDKVTKDKNSLTLREKVKLVNAPLSNDRANEVLNFFKLCIQAQLMLKENNSIFPYDIINNLLKEIKTSKIKELDIAVKKLDIISWMSFNFEDFREIRDNIKNKRIYLNNKIISFLRSN